MTQPRHEPRLTQQLLMSLFDYDPDTGVLTNRVRRSHRHAGEVAGSLDQRGYRIVSVLGRQYFAHRLIWRMVTGDWPTGEVDHINRLKGDNRWANLRDVPKSDNVANAGPRKDNAGGIRGVWRSGRCWRAQVAVRGVSYFLGSFASESEADAAYRLAADHIRQHGPVILSEDTCKGPIPDDLAPTEAEVATLWLSGLTPTQIGQRLGRSMKAISNSARRIRAKGYPLPRLKSPPGALLAAIKVRAFAPQGGEA